MDIDRTFACTYLYKYNTAAWPEYARIPTINYNIYLPIFCNERPKCSNASQKSHFNHIHRAFSPVNIGRVKRFNKSTYL